MNLIMAARALCVAPSIAFAAAFAVLAEGSLLRESVPTEERLVYWLAIALLIVSGASHVAHLRLEQLRSDVKLRLEAGRETRLMLMRMEPAGFFLTQVLAVLMVSMMAFRIGSDTRDVFFWTLLAVVGIASIAGGRIWFFSPANRLIRRWRKRQKQKADKKQRSKRKRRKA